MNQLPLVATCADCDARAVHPTEAQLFKFLRTHFRTSMEFEVPSVPMRKDEA